MAVESSLLPPSTNVIMACHIAGVHDVNRNTTLTNDSFDLVKDWAASITSANVKGILFHNNFSEETCHSVANDNILFIKIVHDPQFNPNVYRYFVYRDFLEQHIQQINAIFITDVSDVVLVNNPFTDPLFVENPTALFCGDEPKLLHLAYWHWVLAYSLKHKTNH